MSYTNRQISKTMLLLLKTRSSWTETKIGRHLLKHNFLPNNGTVPCTVTKFSSYSSKFSGRVPNLDLTGYGPYPVLVT